MGQDPFRGQNKKIQNSELSEFLSSYYFRRYQRGIKNFFTLYSPLVESWGIYDNSSNSPGLVATAYQNGDPVVLQNDLWIQLRNQYENFSNS